MKIGKLNFGGVAGPLEDQMAVTMELGEWYYTDLEPLLKINKKSNGVMTYHFYLAYQGKDIYIIRGSIVEVGMKTRTFDSTVTATKTKGSRRMAIDTLQSKWNKKSKKDGWVTDLDAPKPVSEPMLLHRWDKAAKRRKGPWLVGTKLDGICSVYLPGGHRFFSRKRSEFRVLTLCDAMLRIGPIGAHGEIYRHGYSWEEISGAVSRGKDAEFDSEGRKVTLQNSELHYHMFDRHDMEGFGYLDRLESLLDLDLPENLHVVPSVYCVTEAEVEACMERFLELKYEGAVARTLDGLFEWNSRSWDVLKLKPLFSKEFLLKEITFDKDPKFGKLISYKLIAPNGKTFKATPSSPKEKRAEDYERLRMHPLPKPLWMTAEYRDVYASGVPKFAVAKGFRDDIEMGDE